MLTPVGITRAEAITVTVPKPNVACTPAGKYLDSNVTLPTANVEDTPVGATTAEAVTVTSPTVNVAGTPVGCTNADPLTVTVPSDDVICIPVGFTNEISKNYLTLANKIRKLYLIN